MATIDLILLGIIAVFALFGLILGFVHTFGSIVGMILGAYLASRYYEPIANWVISVTHWGDNISRVVIFIITFVVINRVIGFGFWLLDKLLSIVTRLPFISSLNRFLGLVLGALEGMITIGLAIYFIDRFPLSDTVMKQIGHSTVAPYAVALASVLLPLLPEALRLLKSTVDTVERYALGHIK